jgi:DegV family protein with EDD domain
MVLRIVMDSAGDIPKNWLSEFGIEVIPINIHFGERTFFQGVDLSNEEFYQLVDESGTIPKTSQPTPHQFSEFYRKIANLGDTILSIHVTSKLSGTFSSAKIAARELKNEFNIIPVDSGNGSAGVGFMCQIARKMEQAGMPIEKIVERMTELRKKTEVILTLDTLDYARMSGRVKTLQAALASALNVKPVVVLHDGVLDMSEKVRTRRRSIEKIISKMRGRIGDQLVDIAVLHARDPQSGQDLLERVKKVFNYKEIIFSELSIAIAANLGPGTIGIVAVPVAESKVVK